MDDFAFPLPSAIPPQVYAKLCEPFEPGVDEHYFAGRVSNDKRRGIPMAYIDARAVADRLDAVVGPGNWEDDYTVVGPNQVKCTLTILGVPKRGCGEAGRDESEKLKSAESDALKRAATKFGIGRYLYALDFDWIDLHDGKLPKGWLPPRGQREAMLRAPSAPKAPGPADSPSPPPDQKPGGPRDGFAPVTREDIDELLTMARERGIETDDELLAYANRHLQAPRPLESLSDLKVVQYMKLKTRILPKLQVQA